MNIYRFILLDAICSAFMAVLKITNNITLSWAWVTVSLWFPFALLLAFGVPFVIYDERKERARKEANKKAIGVFLNEEPGKATEPEKSHAKASGNLFLRIMLKGLIKDVPVLRRDAEHQYKQGLSPIDFTKLQLETLESIANVQLNDSQAKIYISLLGYAEKNGKIEKKINL